MKVAEARERAAECVRVLLAVFATDSDNAYIARAYWLDRLPKHEIRKTLRGRGVNLTSEQLATRIIAIRRRFPFQDALKMGCVGRGAFQNEDMQAGDIKKKESKMKKLLAGMIAGLLLAFTAGLMADELPHLLIGDGRIVKVSPSGGKDTKAVVVEFAKGKDQTAPLRVLITQPPPGIKRGVWATVYQGKDGMYLMPHQPLKK